jgi:DNA-directed RNA polymerase subunit beta
MEYKAAHDSGIVLIAQEDGVVPTYPQKAITITDKIGVEHVYKLTKFQRSNQGTASTAPDRPQRRNHHQRRCDCDGASTENGEIALGRNILNRIHDLGRL